MKKMKLIKTSSANKNDENDKKTNNEITMCLIARRHMQVLPRSKLFPEFGLHKQILGVNCVYIIMGNPVDFSMYFVSRSQHACKVPSPKFPTLIGFRKFSTVKLFSWHQKRNVSFRGGSSGAFAAITAIPAGN